VYTTLKLSITGPIVKMADNASSTETEERQSPPLRELNSLADLSQLRREGKSPTAYEIKELKARIKAREEMVELADRMRALEDRERLRILEQPQESSKRRRRTDAIFDTSSSISEPSSSSKSEQPCRKKRRTRGIKVTPDSILCLESSLQEWSYWKREMDRIFESDPSTYSKGKWKILKALDYVDKPLKTLWYTYCYQKRICETKRWKEFLTWSKDTIQNGQNVSQDYHVG
jgi:hypothetical protein